MMDTYSMHQRHSATGVVTGKPMASAGRAGKAGSHWPRLHDVTFKALKKLGISPETARVVIQGFGNVGGMAARLMSAAGFHIVAIVEYDGAVYNPKGLDIAALQQHRKETGSINRIRRRRSDGQGGSDVSGMRRSDSGRHRKRNHVEERRSPPLQDSL